MLSPAQVESYQREGYLMVAGLFDAEEARTLCDHYMRLREAGSYPGDTAGVAAGETDPLRRFPRMIHMHRWDDVSLQWIIDPRLNQVMTNLLGEPPLAVQTMLYFKPPGARGQALHQDQYYLQTYPGTCMAAWLALDDADEENGCLQVVPGSGELPVLCATSADTRVSFTDVTVPIPEHLAARPVTMRAGDVVFFNGSLIHGSFPNTSRDRFRRALIGHYVVGNAERVSQFYHPVLRMDGTAIPLGISERGGPCGVWRTEDGHSIVELVEAGTQA